jgi:hypothetical protein
MVLDEINVEKAVHFLQFGRLLKWKNLVKKRSGRKIKVRYISSGGRQQFGACET